MFWKTTNELSSGNTRKQSSKQRHMLTDFLFDEICFAPNDGRSKPSATATSHSHTKSDDNNTSSLTWDKGE